MSHQFMDHPHTRVVAATPCGLRVGRQIEAPDDRAMIIRYGSEAHWLEVVTISVRREMSLGEDGKTERWWRVATHYGSGGHNDGFTMVQIATAWETIWSRVREELQALEKAEADGTVEHMVRLIHLNYVAGVNG